jgi:hypothetical protein
MTRRDAIMWSTKGQPTEIRLKRWLRKRDSVRAIDRVIDYFGNYRRSCEAERSAAALRLGVVGGRPTVRVRL